MSILPGQMDVFQLLADEDRESPLDMLIRHRMHEGARLRILAALTFPHFQQYADRWMRTEYTGGTYSRSASGGRVLEYALTGATWAKGTEAHAYSWAQMTARARELIWGPDWLNREEEWIVNDLRGELPYPAPCASYPAEAWKSAPPLWTGICTRCATLDRCRHGACLRCGGKVRPLTDEERGVKWA